AKVRYQHNETSLEILSVVSEFNWAFTKIFRLTPYWSRSDMGVSEYRDGKLKQVFFIRHVAKQHMMLAVKLVLRQANPI
ncbi:unnamed protein product, partial [Effrenium voratum]